ncbi:MAG: hypothetical protein AB7O38_05325 [Pirellulaceae bacterium]
MNRGGSWNNNARNCRAAYRNRNSPSNRNNNLGFRVALAPRVGRMSARRNRPLSGPALVAGKSHIGRPVLVAVCERSGRPLRLRTPHSVIAFTIQRHPYTARHLRPTSTPARSGLGGLAAVSAPPTPPRPLRLRFGRIRSACLLAGRN